MCKIGILLVNYNGKNFLNDCINSIYKMKYKNIDILVVDNDSHDNSIDLLEIEYPDVKVIKTGDNIGVAAGNNVGIRHFIKTDCDYILIMNNDVEVDKNMLNYLIQQAGPNTITVPKIYYFNDKDVIWFGGGHINWHKGICVHEGYNERDNKKYDSDRYITYAPTCCMLVHKSVFDKIGIMDENYFMYFDDTDFCVRAIDGGVKILYVPKAFMWHKVSSSSGGPDSKISIYYNYRNQLYFINKFKEKVRLSCYFYIHIRSIYKYLLSFLFHTNYTCLLECYMDFYNKNFGRKDFV